MNRVHVIPKFCFSFSSLFFSARAGTMSPGHKELYQNFLKKLAVNPKKARVGQFDSLQDFRKMYLLERS